MKKNNKGFTLIELLAVIVILAIIALIATPIVLNMISNARRSAAKSSALGYIDSINSFVPLAKSASDLDLDDYQNVDGNNKTPISVPTSVKCVKQKDGNSTDWTGTGCAAFYAKVDAKTKGKKPDELTITIDTNDQVSLATGDTNFKLVFGAYTCTYNGSEVECND